MRERFIKDPFQGLILDNSNASYCFEKILKINKI